MPRRADQTPLGSPHAAIRALNPARGPGRSRHDTVHLSWAFGPPTSSHDMTYPLRCLHHYLVYVPHRRIRLRDSEAEPEHSSTLRILILILALATCSDPRLETLTQADNLRSRVKLRIPGVPEGEMCAGQCHAGCHTGRPPGPRAYCSAR
ncbi:hypothetical protein BD779DRAFT_1675233 [Infundibulicybe gibba]|nr:hypothetical protein BD779DRAFT_1675233 [Infundibulicybe gibba]